MKKQIEPFGIHPLDIHLDPKLNLHEIPEYLSCIMSRCQSNLSSKSILWF